MMSPKSPALAGNVADWIPDPRGAFVTQIDPPDRFAGCADSASPPLVRDDAEVVLALFLPRVGKGHLSTSLSLTGGRGEPRAEAGVAFRTVSLPENTLGGCGAGRIAMWRAGFLVAATVAMFLTGPAAAGDWQYDPGTDTIFYGSTPIAQWYAQPRPMQTETRPRHHPQRVARCPHRMCGYPLPIHKAPRAWPVEPSYRAVFTDHATWCAAWYRSYDPHTDTFQPNHGPRRSCRSPY
jgi:hypothetical protein